MGLKDAPYGRSPDTQFRDLLRRLERDQIASHPARPTEPPLMALRAIQAPGIAIGSWVLSEDTTTGDLVATDPDGNTHVVIPRGAS
jgi:hypothetical protein